MFLCIGDKVTFTYLDGTQAGVFVVTDIYYSFSFGHAVIEVETVDAEEDFKGDFRGEEIKTFKLKKVG